MTIPQALQIAAQHHQAGRLPEAEALYRQILTLQPDHADALHFLGVIAHQVGRHEIAVQFIRQAIGLNPNSPFAYYNLGEAYRAAGRLEEGIAAYRHALELKPDYVEAHNNLGTSLVEGGRFEQAITAFRHALDHKPDSPEIHNNLGATLAKSGLYDEAVAAYRQALNLRPGFSGAYNNLGDALREQGQLGGAITAFRRALEIQPAFPEAHYNLGNAQRERGQLTDAISSYRRALELKTGYPEACNNLGITLCDRHHLDEGIAAYRRALELKPDYAEAHNNLGNALRNRGEVNEAIASFHHALEIKRDDAEVHSNLIFTIHSHQDCDDRTIFEEHQRWNRQFGEPLKQFLRPHANDRDPERRLRVGYVSPDFRDHVVGHYVLPLLEGHDLEGFEILCYSGVVRSDWMTERFRALRSGRSDADGGWRSTVGVSDARVAEIIREDGIDILVDLAMHTAGNRLPVLARQPAPVQVSWLAYPGKTGLRGIGYRLTDAHIDPPVDEPACLSEEPMRLPHSWCSYKRPAQSPEIGALPALSSGGVTFGSLNNFAKVNQRVLACWARMLEAVKGSRLLMLCPEGRARERVREFFGARGIARERIELVSIMPYREYMSLYLRIDIGLDPFPCNGMTTTCDALWMGVPVVTLPGRMSVSRAGLSLLSNVGLGELAASSEEDYVRMVVDLAGNLRRLANVRAALRPRMLASPLMDVPRFARNVEAAYRSIWRTWCEKQSPAAEEL